MESTVSNLNPSLPGSGAIFAAVYATIEDRRRTMPEKSYVAGLLRRGTDGICCKVAEECGEVIKAAREQTPDDVSRELCDLFFHCMVLMADRQITFKDIEFEFGRRHGISGLEEKANRSKSEG